MIRFSYVASCGFRPQDTALGLKKQSFNDSGINSEDAHAGRNQVKQIIIRTRQRDREDIDLMAQSGKFPGRDKPTVWIAAPEGEERHRQ